MSTQSVKFLNTECYLIASVMVRREYMEGGSAEQSARYEAHLTDHLGRLLGASIVDGKAEVTTVRDPVSNEYIRQAGVYVLSPMDMRHLYGLIRDEIRDESYTKGEKELLGEVDALKDTIDCQDEDLAVLRKELQEAKASGTRADKAAETLRKIADGHADLGASRYQEIKKLEEKTRRLETQVADQATMINRMSATMAKGLITPMVIEAIMALRDEPSRFWDADVDNFVDELVTRLKGESK